MGTLIITIIINLVLGILWTALGWMLAWMTIDHAKLNTIRKLYKELSEKIDIINGDKK